MADFIDLERQFVEFNPKAQGEADSHSHLFSLYGSKGWSDILALPCTVIIAEAGNGKTTELRHQTDMLRQTGKPAFFCNMALLADNPLPRALEIGTAKELGAWQQGDERGYFFLDAVDEAKLVDPRAFQQAILNLLEIVEPHRQRATIVLSTRPHAWQAYADRAMLAARLGLQEQKTARDAESESNEADEAQVATAESESGASSTQRPPQPINVVQLAPLDEKRVRTFARKRGVSNVDTFIDAIERADADLFATRPADLPGLIKIWNEEGRIGSYSEVVRGNIELKLSEFNTTHQRYSIAVDRAMAGAEMLAAAATFARRTSMLVPDQPVDSALRARSLDPTHVLRDWTPSEIQALLGRALFDESLYGTVRFHHRTARECLTASWLRRLLKDRKSRRQVESLLFARPYGQQREVIRPSMKPIVGWLAGWDQRIRDKALHIDPTVLLEHGDAAAIDIGTRAKLLKEFAGRYEDRNYTPLNLHIREVRRLASQNLAPEIRSLLKQYRGHHDVRELLLRIIREGVVTGCSDLATAIALDKTMATYSRVCAVQVVGVTGSAAEKTKVAARLISDAAALDHQILGAAVESLFPEALGLDQVVTILAACEAPEAFSSSQLDHELDRLAERLVAETDKLKALRLVTELLETSPLHDGRYCPISKRYDWLLPFANKLARNLSGQTPLDPAVLTVLAMSECAQHMHRYTGDVGNHTAQLISTNRAVKHALFWHLAKRERARKRQPLVDWVFAVSHSAVTSFDLDDAAHFLNELKQRPDLDERKLALSVLMAIYGRAGKPADLMDKIRAIVNGNEVLTAALDEHLVPRPLSKEMQQALQQDAKVEKAGRRRKKKDEQDRTRWIADLRKEPSKVGDLSIAPEGKVWNNTAYLLGEIRKKKKSSNSHWALEYWEILKPEFGDQIAENLRDFCIALWRRYRPQLRSEIGQESSGVPWVVIAGLSGLGMEVRVDPNWATRLTDDEVHLATRYALWEMNALPTWFDGLYRAHTSKVTAVLLEELRWEFRAPRSSVGSGHVLSRLRWHAKDLGEGMRPHLLELVAENGSADVATLAEALTVILRDASALPKGFASLVEKRASAAEEAERKALWLSALLCLNAHRALPEIEAWVETPEAKDEREQRLTPILEYMWGHRFDSFTSEHKDYMKPDILVRLLKLAHTTIRSEDDTRRSGVVTSRHHAQEARGHLLELLYGIPGQETYRGLLELSAFHTHEYAKDRTLVLAEQRAELDAENPAWSEGYVTDFAREAELEPSTEAELFKLALSRLDDLKLDLEDGDESDASLVRRVADEPELRRVLANRLRQAAQFKYTTGSEEELADKKRTDIRLHHPRVQQRVPIELKIAGKSSGNNLRERLKTQLTGQYLRSARHGIFLVVNRGAKDDLKTWVVSGKKVDFAGLIAWLKNEANALLVVSTTVDALQVVGIDLLTRDQAATKKQTTRSKSPSKRKTDKRATSDKKGR